MNSYRETSAGMSACSPDLPLQAADGHLLCLAKRSYCQNTGADDEIQLPLNPNRRQEDDAGMLVTLLLDKVVIENNQFLENGLPIFWNILEERIAAVLMVSSLDIVLWDTRQLGSSVEVTLPARAASRLSHLMPVPCDRLKKLGVMTACLGEINATTDALEENTLQNMQTQHACIYLTDHSVDAFKKEQSRRMTQICVAMQARVSEQHRLLQVTAHKHGVRLYMLLEADCCRHLCKAVADGSHSAAGCGILRVVVRNKKNVPLGWTLAKKEQDEKKEEDQREDRPKPDKPDQESETWLSWVRLRQRRGTQLGSTIYLVRGNNSGKAAWHYVDVKDSLITEFREKTRGGFLDVADYGEVLISGWGEDPPQDVVDIIARDWG